MPLLLFSSPLHPYAWISLSPTPISQAVAELRDKKGDEIGVFTAQWTVRINQ